ncbi:homocysteine S-methyltransferase family protein [Aestuariivirga sp.]|uniref:homocysteine S-methyltransferase family protein n=1 Tax=Aestuariivirga sp. TaxID=2650926 RepID=UPI003BA97A39
MSRYRDGLPQLGNGLFLSDSGLETTLIFQEGQTLPCFAAFTLLETSAGRDLLKRYFKRHLAIAVDHRMGFILDTPTWRASRDWAERLAIPEDRLGRLQELSVELAEELRREHETKDTPVVISGVLGPRGDGYRPESIMHADEARRYHLPQIARFVETAADMVSAMTITHTGEAIGMVQAAREAAIPISMSFTTEVDGHLPSGQDLGEAIIETDEATGGYASYYMVNCAHPSHFLPELAAEASWVRRIRGIRANASKLSHAELDEAVDLDDGDPKELGEDYGLIRSLCPWINILGGCCGTDVRHIRAISERVRRA